MERITYRSGEVPQVGDQVLYNMEPGEVEVVLADDPLDWGPDLTKEDLQKGLLIVTASLGRALVDADDDGLDFVSRKSDS